MERGLAASTVESYRRDLRRYASVLARRGKTGLGEITPADVADYLASLREGDAGHAALAVSSAARAVIAVRGLHAFAVAQGLADTDPAREVPPVGLDRAGRQAALHDQVLQVAAERVSERLAQLSTSLRGVYGSAWASATGSLVSRPACVDRPRASDLSVRRASCQPRLAISSA